MSDLNFYDLTYDGPVVQAILDTAQELRQNGYIFKGVGTPSTVPGTPTQRVWYLCGPGTYANFGSSVTVPEGSVMVASYASSTWTKTVVEVTGGGVSFASGETVGDVSLFDELSGLEGKTSAEKAAMIPDGNVMEELEGEIAVAVSNDGVNDLSLSDENDNHIAEFYGGDIRTRNFDSAALPSIGESFVDFEICDENGNAILRVVDGGVITKNGANKPYQRRIPFEVEVDATNFLLNDFTAEGVDTCETQTIYTDNAVLYLPSAYKQTGTPTKVIVYCKHGSMQITQASDVILTGSDGKIFRYMLACGYAILAADGLPDGWATDLGLCERVVGNYVAVQSTIKAWEWATANYNLDKTTAFIFGWSQGGHYAQNVIDNSNIPFAAAAEMSPVCSMRYHQWDLSATVTVGGVTFDKGARLNVARIFGYPSFTTNAQLNAMSYDPTKDYGYDPWTRNVEDEYTGFVQNGDLWEFPSGTTVNDITMKKHLRCPLKLWCAENDAVLGVDVMTAFIKAVKNAGQVADLQLYTTGGHDIPSVQTSIGTFTENGESVALYPIAKDVAIWFARFGGYDLV